MIKAAISGYSFPELASANNKEVQEIISKIYKEQAARYFSNPTTSCGSITFAELSVGSFLRKSTGTTV